MAELALPTASGATTLEGLHERLFVDTSESQPVHLLVGRNRSFIRLSATAYHLLLWRAEGLSYEEISGRMGMVPSTAHTEEVEKAYLKVAGEIERIEASGLKKRFGFLFELPMLNERLVQRLSRGLTWVFHPTVVTACLPVIALSFLFFFHSDIHFRINSHYEFWMGYLILIASTLIHELGHAAACARYGQPPSAIGFTIYLIYPALYSDVSAAWRLNRWQRVVVDLGGFYFQFILVAAFAMAYSFWPWAPLRIAVFGVIASAAFSLNPVFRMDGYWVLADALGVTNLADQPKRVLSMVWGRMRGHSAERLPWPNPILGFLFLYTLVVFSVWGLFAWKLGPSLFRMAKAYPQDLLTLCRTILGGGGVGPGIYVFLMKSVSIAFLGYMVYQFLLMLRSMVRTGPGKPDRELGPSQPAS